MLSSPVWYTRAVTTVLSPCFSVRQVPVGRRCSTYGSHVCRWSWFLWCQDRTHPKGGALMLDGNQKTWFCGPLNPKSSYFKQKDLTLVIPVELVGPGGFCQFDKNQKTTKYLLFFFPTFFLETEIRCEPNHHTVSAKDPPWSMSLRDLNSEFSSSAFLKPWTTNYIGSFWKMIFDFGILEISCVSLLLC